MDPASTTHDELEPNHHAHHPGFGGLSGLAAAVSMTIGRTADARVAIELSGLRAGDRLVDIGCGPGVAAREAARQGADVVGVDPAGVMLRVARRTARGAPIRWCEGTAEDLPVDDASMTVAWALACVHHWVDLDAGLAEVHRVLEPGGRFLAVERRTRVGATGLAGHGWTDAQARVFADRCRAVGFEAVSVSDRVGGRGQVLAVTATRPPAGGPAETLRSRRAPSG